MNPRHHDIGIGSIPRITTMIKSQSKDLLLLLIFRFSMINAVPRSRLYLLAQKEISAGGKDITNSILQHPFGRIIDEISFFHHRLLLTLWQYDLLFRKQTLIDSSTYRYTGCRINPRSQTNDFIIEKEPGLFSCGIYISIGIKIWINRYAIKTIRDSSCKYGSSLRLPINYSSWNGIQLRSSHSRNTIPVPYRKDAGVLVPFGHDVCTSVGHKIGFQIFTIPIFASHGTIGNHTNVKCIVGTDMKSIVSSEIMSV